MYFKNISNGSGNPNISLNPFSGKDEWSGYNTTTSEDPPPESVSMSTGLLGLIEILSNQLQVVLIMLVLGGGTAVAAAILANKAGGSGDNVNVQGTIDNTLPENSVVYTLKCENGKYFIDNKSFTEETWLDYLKTKRDLALKSKQTIVIKLQIDSIDVEHSVEAILYNNGINHVEIDKIPQKK